MSDDEDSSATRLLKEVTRALAGAGPTSSFIEQFATHTERGAALGAVAILDDRLEAILKARMIDDDEVKTAMFSEICPLSGLGARIRLGYLLGIFGQRIYKDMLLISKIRNTFAHKSEAYDFTHARVQGLVSGLSVCKIFDMRHALDGQLSGIITSFDAAGYDLAQANYRFIAAVILICLVISHGESAGRQ